MHVDDQHAGFKHVGMLPPEDGEDGALGCCMVREVRLDSSWWACVQMTFYYSIYSNYDPLTWSKCTLKRGSCHVTRCVNLVMPRTM